MMNSFSQNLKKVINIIPMPIWILIFCILAYGLLIPWLGFYLDDWYIVLYQKYFGAGNFSAFFENDRPLFAYVYDVFVPVFRDSKIAWQIFTLFTHALAASSFWWLLIKLMPSRRKLAAVAALLFTVYPGFQFHWFSVMYGQVFMLYAIYFLSYILMINAVRAVRGKVFYWLGAILCLVIGVVPQETFLGLELARPIVIWIVMAAQSPDKRKRFKQTLLCWLPFLLVLIGFVIYRLGYTENFSYQASLFNELKAEPLTTILRMITEVFWGAVDAILVAWINLIELLKRDLLSTVSAVMLLLIMISMGLSYFLLKRKPEDEEHPLQNHWIIWISLLLTISAMAPFLAGSFKITLDFPNNRYLLALAPGACLFLAAGIDTLLRTHKQKLIISSVLIGFAIGSQFLTARSFMLTWQAQQDFFWQLTWRAPEIKANTILVTEDLPFSDFFSGTSLTAPLNLIYSPDSSSQQIPYLIILTSQQKEVIQSYSLNQPINYNFRSFDFSGNTSAMLVFKKPADGCLRIASPDDLPEAYMKNEDTEFWKAAIPLSNLNQIVVSTETDATLPIKYFSNENRNQWCYYYEKADLARQQEDWQRTVQLYSEAEDLGLKPYLDVELLPLVEAYINIGKLDLALETTKQITDIEQNYVSLFCNLWSELINDEVGQVISSDALNYLHCANNE